MVKNLQLHVKKLQRVSSVILQHAAVLYLLDFWARQSCRPPAAPCEPTSSCSWRSAGGPSSEAVKLQRWMMEEWSVGTGRKSPRQEAARSRCRGQRRFPRGCGSSWRSRRCPSSCSGCRWSWGWPWLCWWTASKGPGWQLPCGPSWS